MQTQDWLSSFFNQGAPLLILGFILWFLVKPLFAAHVDNIKKNTELLQRLVDSCNDMKRKHDDLHDKFEQLERKLNVKA